MIQTRYCAKGIRMYLLQVSVVVITNAIKMCVICRQFCPVQYFRKVVTKSCVLCGVKRHNDRMV
jgi:hypothetical protein